MVQRRRISGRARKFSKLMDNQDGCCIYCGNKFGDIVNRGGSKEILAPHLDHFVPYSYKADSSLGNLLLACHVCNKLKFDKMFDSLEHAVRYLFRKWMERGYEVI